MENERKYVVSHYAELEHLLTPLGWKDITQGYLNSQNRVRRIIQPNGDRTHFFAFKQRMASGQNLEIEPPISDEQFDEAWEYTHERLSKRRVPIIHDDLTWDVDFYRWSQPYFVLAEVEMPPTMRQPKVILPQLRPYLVYEVPQTDDRFTARRLSDEAHVRTMARLLGLL